jgi:hypothetical protein
VKAVVLLAVAIGMLAMLAIGMQMIGGAVQDLPSDQVNSTEVNGTAGSVAALMGGASLLPFAMLIGALVVVFYGFVRMVS